METTRFCKKCLLKELSQDDYFRNVYEVLEQLSPDVKASDEEYVRRLALCQRCDNLINGMCRVCGCFVELRAAKTHNTCPSVEHYW